jgi:hypothetical protein
MGRAPPSPSAWQSFYPFPVRMMDDAAAFVAAVGFCTWMPIPGLAFPNLAEAMGGENAGRGPDAYRVMDTTWFWKDDLHVARRLHYAKIVRGQPSFIAPDFLPDFVAALGDRERDPRRLYLDGLLSREAIVIHDFLVEHPARPSRELRRGTGPRAHASGAAIERALTDLQRRFLICKVDITGRTRGTYSYVWDVAERFWPEEFARADALRRDDARDRIRERLEAFGIRTDPALEAKLFLWR